MHNMIFISSSANGHIGCFHVFAIINSAPVSIEVHIYFWNKFFSWYMLKSGISGSNGSFIFSFLRNLHTVLNSGCINLYSHQECRRVPFSLHLLQYLCLQIFLIMAILTAVRKYFIVVLIYVSLIISWEIIAQTEMDHAEVYQLRRTTQKRGLEELLLAQGQGQRLRVPGCIGTGAAERSCPTSEVRAEAGRSYHMPEVRGCGREEQPHVQGQEGRPWGDIPHPR